MEHHEQITALSKGVADGASAMIVVGTLFQWLPSVAALLTVVWTLIRIWETKTVQAMISRRRPVVVPVKDE